MTRSEAYAKVKELNLQDFIKSSEGRNFTQVGTDKLIAYIEGAGPCCCNNPGPEATVCEKKQEEPAATDVNPHSPIETDNVYEATCLAFLGILKDVGVLDGMLAKLS